MHFSSTGVFRKHGVGRCRINGGGGGGGGNAVVVIGLGDFLVGPNSFRLWYGIGLGSYDDEEEMTGWI